jgi:hypothetical protein
MSALGSTDNVESLSQRRELSDAAQVLLADKAFSHALLELRKRWFGELMLLPHASPKQDELTARIRALEAFGTELAALAESYRNDLKMKARHAS